MTPSRKIPGRWAGPARLALSAASLGLAVAIHAQPSAAVPEVEGSSHGYPVLRDLEGRRLADGEFMQWIENGRLWIRNTYDFGGNHRVEELAVFRLEPLAQEEWLWREFVGGSIEREYAVDLKSGGAHARKRESGEIKQWREQLDVEPGRTFAGVGFTTAIKSLRDRLVRGDTIEVRAVGFTPKPRLVTVKISHGGIDEMSMSGRTLTGDRFVIEPQIPAIAKLFFEAPETRIWLTHPPPAGFLRWEGALAEPGDPIVRVDLLPGDPSGEAKPTRSSARAPTDR